MKAATIQYAVASDGFVYGECVELPRVWTKAKTLKEAQRDIRTFLRRADAGNVSLHEVFVRAE